MIDLKQYGYTKTEPPPGGLIPGRVTELQREQYTIITGHGEVTAVLKGAFYHGAEVRGKTSLWTIRRAILRINEHGIKTLPNGASKRKKWRYQEVNQYKLKKVLRRMFGTKITRADYQTKQLHGGTLGDVRLITGTAETANGEKHPYKVVWKTQKKWERYGDPGSWRREYDLYASELKTAFTNSFRWPECYYSEMNNDETEIQLWMEYIDGVSGLDLTGDMYEHAAEELGRFQGKLYSEQPSFLKNLTNMSKVDYAKSFYLHYRSWKKVYDYIRSDGCEIPRHICEMLIGIDDNSDEVWSRIEKLPIVLCHRDFWVTNIFYTDGKIALIDWDTTGWGYLGEDIASLIADEADVDHMIEHFQRCVPAYYKGFSEYADISHITDHCVRELILVLFGYRLVEWYLNAESDEEKMLQVNTLQKIYEMRVK